MAWTAIFIGILFLILKLVHALKVSNEEELRGKEEKISNQRIAIV